MGEYYNKCPYLTAEARKTIGKELNLEPSQVLIRAYFDIGLVDTKGLILNYIINDTQERHLKRLGALPFCTNKPSVFIKCKVVPD